jgi:uncharacterized protein (TIGR00106 family)
MASQADEKASDLLKIATPAKCTADFCLIPLGTPTASVSKEVAEVQRILKRSGLNYSMHSAGTTIGESINMFSVFGVSSVLLLMLLCSEGSWDDCMRVIGQCHALLHQNGVVRIQSDIRIGTRTDKNQTFAQKVSAVENILAKDA